ncbi:MAG: NAD(P)-dependent oxidoreductase [Methyloligellaceae bacterium]
MTDNAHTLGFVGLGQMGGPMAANIVKAGFPLLCFDKAGTAERLPEDATAANSLGEVLARADTVFLSLPAGADVLSVVNEIAVAEDRRTSLVVDLSTIGPAASKRAAEILAKANIGFADAPVSGGRAGALAGTITLIWAGPKAELARHHAVIDAFCGNPFHVGDEPGQGQAVKLLNNFLSATAMAATSEAVLYGLSQGLDMKTILDVVNVSTGRNTASMDKFPQRILTGTFDAGFYANLLAKDVQLYIDNVRAADTPRMVGTAVADLWRQCSDALPPGTDMTRIYDFIRDKS